VKARLEALLRRVVPHRLKSVWEFLNERWYGIATVERGEHARVGDAERYGSPDYLLLRRTARILRTHVGPDDVLYDVGCGKGRVLAVMSRLPFGQLVGVELDPGLAEVARDNMQSLRGSRAPIEIQRANALDVDFDPGTVFYFVNPFGVETMRKVVAKLRDSVARRPRRVLVVYHNALYAELMDDSGFLERFHTFTTPGGKNVVLWRSLAGAS
jgi:SAM-dependent methyltransferase